MPVTVSPDGVIVTVRATPRATRPAVAGVVAMADGHPALAVRVAVPPVEGKANAAIVDLLARALGVRRGDVTILSGETGRAKRIAVRGDGALLAGRIRTLAGGGDQSSSSS